MDWNRWDVGRTAKSSTLTVLLVALSLVGPAVAYAGVQVVWPASTDTLNVNEDPPITFDKGDDFSSAKSNNFTGDWVGHNNNASYTVTLSGLSGGNLTVDRWLNVTVNPAIQDFELNITEAIGEDTLGSSSINYATIRLWNATNGDPAPTTNASLTSQCELSLTAGVGTSSQDCPDPSTLTGTGNQLKMQVVYDLADDVSGFEDVSVTIDDVRFD